MDSQHDGQRVGLSPPSGLGVEGADAVLRVGPRDQAVHPLQEHLRRVLRFLPWYSRACPRPRPGWSEKVGWSICLNPPTTRLVNPYYATSHPTCSEDSSLSPFGSSTWDGTKPTGSSSGPWEAAVEGTLEDGLLSLDEENAPNVQVIVVKH